MPHDWLLAKLASVWYCSLLRGNVITGARQRLIICNPETILKHDLVEKPFSNVSIVSIPH